MLSFVLDAARANPCLPRRQVSETNSRSLASTTSFIVNSAIWHWAHMPRKATITLLPSTSISSMSPPSGPQGGPDLLVDRLLDELDLLDVGQLLRGWRRAGGCGSFGLLALDACDDLLDLALAAAAAAAGLAVVGHLLDGGQVVLADRPARSPRRSRRSRCRRRCLRARGRADLPPAR